MEAEIFRNFAQLGVRYWQRYKRGVLHDSWIIEANGFTIGAKCATCYRNCTIYNRLYELNSGRNAFTCTTIVSNVFICPCGNDLIDSYYVPAIHTIISAVSVDFNVESWVTIKEAIQYYADKTLNNYDEIGIYCGALAVEEANEGFMGDTTEYSLSRSIRIPTLADGESLSNYPARKF